MIPRQLSRPALFLVLAIVIAAQFVPLPYAVLQPGPAYDLLGSNIKTSLPTYKTPGKLFATTVLVSNPDANITAPVLLATWMDGQSVVVPKDVLYPTHEKASQLEAKGKAEMATSQNVAVTAASNYLSQVDPVLAQQLRTTPIKFTLKETGGPSAGLGFALAIIAKLKVPNLIDGRSIAATGTINEQGAVGPIGGIDQKLIGASHKGAKIFLIPAQNCSDITRIPLHMQIVPVKSLNEAVHFLAGASFEGTKDGTPHC